ncbi:MAG: GumC family protein, partial [Terriglobales bacterium]
MHHSSFVYKLLTQIRYRIALPLLVFVFALMIARPIVQQTRPSYKASVRIWVQQGLRRSSGDAPTPGETPSSPLLDGFSALTNLCEIVQSDAVLKLAHDDLEQKLKGKHVPTVDELSSVKASPVQNASIITIEYRCGDAEVATAAVDSVVAALIKENAIQAAGPLEETRHRLELELGLAQKDHKQSQERIRKFQDQNQSLDLEEEIKALTEGRADIEKDLADTEHDLNALHVKIDFSQKQLGFGPDDVLMIEKIANDEVVNHLKKTISETEVKLIELRSKFQEDHPRVKRMKAIMEDAKKEIQNRYSVLVGKVEGQFEGISPENEVQQKLLDDMIEARSDIVTLESKRASLQEYLQQIAEQLVGAPIKQQELGEIERQDELATGSLAAIERELQRIKLTESV